jgi:hypothetical protein
MKTKTWAAFGSVMINLMLGLVIAAVFSAAPLARADEAHACAAHAAAHSHPAPAQPAPATTPTRKSYIVAVRMGWAMG